MAVLPAYYCKNKGRRGLRRTPFVFQLRWF
jgi:hypothetical protein